MNTYQVSYQTTNTFDTLNEWTEDTEYVVIAFHGIGYLSRYFIKLFEGLPQSKYFVVAPQAPSKFYKDAQYKRVGASWLTKENTELEIANLYQYIDQVVNWTHEQSQLSNGNKIIKYILFGFSQGVSVMTRWLTNHFKWEKPAEIYQLIMVGGRIPTDISEESTLVFKNKLTKVQYIYGDQDVYFKNLEKQIMIQEQNRITKLFPTMKIHTYQGGHQINLELVQSFLTSED